MPDNPADYVKKLEAENRALRARVDQLTRETTNLRLENLDAEGRVRMAVSSATSASMTAERALTRVQEWKPIVDAAIAHYELDGRAGSCRAVDCSVEAEIARRESST